MKKFTDTFIRRPILSISISLLIVLLGLQALSSLQIRQYPQMTNTVVTVTTSYYGAGGDQIQGFITQPLEQAIAQANNIDFMTSQSLFGSSVITVYMKLDTDPDGAVANILAKVNSVLSQLPKAAENPTISVSTGSTTSLIYIAFSSNVLNDSEITDYLERVVQPQILTVAGVSTVNLYGGNDFAMRIWIDPQKMAAYELSATEVTEILQANNFQSSPGMSNGYFTQLDGEAETQVQTIDSLKNIVISTYKGTVVRLKDIASVSMSKSHDTVRAQANGKDAVIVAVNPTPTANPLEITKQIREMLPSIKRNKPDTINMDVVYDSTIAIKDSINEVIKTLVEAVIIVLIVIILFLGSMRAASIPIITIPLSLIGVMLMMQIFGFSINLLTLLAMVLAIGLVVDDAIVVLENVDRHIKLGQKPYAAAIIGTREIAIPVITMTITLAAVYAPIALMGGITGALFKEFALTLAGAVFISGIVALTLSPMISSKLLVHNNNPNYFEKTVNKAQDKVVHMYSKALNSVMNHRIVIIIFAIIVFTILPVLFSFIPTELAPKEDDSAFMMIGTAPSNSNLDYIQATMGKMSKDLGKQKETVATIAIAGVPAGNQGLGVGVITPWGDRSNSQQEFMNNFTKTTLKTIPEMAISAINFPALPGSSSGLPVQFVISTANDFKSLNNIASNILSLATQNPIFDFTTIDLKFDSGGMRININRDKAGAYGVTMQAIGNTLTTMISDAYINRVTLLGRSYEVIPQVIRKNRMNPESLKNYYVKASDKNMIPLSNLVDVEIFSKPLAYTHFNQMNSATISAVISPEYSMGDAVNYFNQTIAPTLPQGYSYSFLGEARQYVEEGNSLYVVFLLSLCVIYLVLASQFESLRDPLVILVSVPLAISGALLVLAWGAATMNIYSQVGLITLIGLISKHGILICEVAKEVQLSEGLNRIDAVTHAAKIRLRPIMMTTAAMVAGLIPLLYASGSGAASRFSIGVVIVSGLSLGTLFTLFILPVVYTYIASIHKPLPDDLE
tara:strand:- start:12687 stop:15743 length:3057 start_codon:yes stop_codon:yes gene_type:complete